MNTQKEIRDTTKANLTLTKSKMTAIENSVEERLNKLNSIIYVLSWLPVFRASIKKNKNIKNNKTGIRHGLKLNY